MSTKILTSIFRSVARSSIAHFVCPSVRLSLTVRVFLHISYVYYAIGKILTSYYAEHNVWSYGRVVTYLEVATQLGKVPLPIIMYGHMMDEGVKNYLGY